MKPIKELDPRTTLFFYYEVKSSSNKPNIPMLIAFINGPSETKHDEIQKELLEIINRDINPYTKRSWLFSIKSRNNDYFRDIVNLNVFGHSAFYLHLNVPFDVVKITSKGEKVLIINLGDES
jgi:hypothetical protein